MCVCVCVCVCVCICMYMDVCVLWVAGGIIFNIFEIASECLDICLSILVQRPYKELCPQKPARPEERDEECGQRGVRLQSRVSKIQVQDAGLVSRL